MTTILLIQLFKEPPLGISSLEVELNLLFGSQMVALDNFSEGSNLAYVRKMIEASNSIRTIVWEYEGGAAKGMQPIFNALLKKRQTVSLVTNANQGVISKLAKALGSELVKSEGELISVLKRQSHRSGSSGT